MRRRSLSAFVLAVVLLLVPVKAQAACALLCGAPKLPPLSDPPPPAPPTTAEEADVMLGLINVERTNHGLAPLASREDIATYAAAHSAAMAEAGSIWHNDDYFTKATKARFGASMVGENVAVNSTTANAHARLMNSPGHRANILEPNFTHVGIGIARATTGGMYFTQDFLKSTGPAAKPAPAPTPEPEHAPASEPAPAPAPVDESTRVVRAPRPRAAAPPTPRAAPPAPPAAPATATQPQAAPSSPDPAVTVPGPDAVLGQRSADAPEVAEPQPDEIAAAPGTARGAPLTQSLLGALLVLAGLLGLGATTKLLRTTCSDLFEPRQPT